MKINQKRLEVFLSKTNPHLSVSTEDIGEFEKNLNKTAVLLIIGLVLFLVFAGLFSINTGGRISIVPTTGLIIGLIIIVLSILNVFGFYGEEYHEVRSALWKLNSRRDEFCRYFPSDYLKGRCTGLVLLPQLTEVARLILKGVKEEENRKWLRAMTEAANFFFDDVPTYKVVFDLAKEQLRQKQQARQ